MTANVDREGCIACGLCEMTAPNVFRMEDGAAAVICREIAPEDEGQVREARDACPVSVITIGE